MTEQREIWVDARVVRAVLRENMAARLSEPLFGSRWVTNHLGLAFRPGQQAGSSALRPVRIEKGTALGVPAGWEFFDLPTPGDEFELGLMGESIEGKAYLRSRGGWRGRLRYADGFDWHSKDPTVDAAVSALRPGKVAPDRELREVQCPKCDSHQRSDEIWKRGRPHQDVGHYHDTTILWKHVCQQCGYGWEHWDGEPELLEWKRLSIARDRARAAGPTPADQAAMYYVANESRRRSASGGSSRGCAAALALVTLGALFGALRRQ